jgi:hypothetical protein
MDSQKLLAWLDELQVEAADYGWEFEQIDALVRIGEHTIKLGLADSGVLELVEKMEEITDFMEQWGPDSDLAEELSELIRKYLV